MTDFSAGPQTIGYLHQVRYALVVLLDREDCELRLEALDDIDLSKPGSPAELLQLKHRAPGTSLTDASSDLWNTLRVWSTLVREGALLLDQALLSLVTTALAPDESAAAYLRPGAGRDAEAAQVLLTKVANESQNAALKAAFGAFLELNPETRGLLMSRIYVLDDGPSIVDARAQLESKLAVAVQREHRAALADRVEGWWFQRCVEHLRRDRPSLSGFEVFDKIVELAQQFQRDSLPIDFLGAEPSSKEKESLAIRVFVQQLQSVAVSAGRIQNAIIDYYRAYAQRSRWARDDLLVGDEIEQYEDRLRDEWNRMRLILLDELDKPEAEDKLRKLGRDLLTWMETTANVKIRANVTEPYVMRGSYHMLADEDPPRVWWHPKFKKRVEEVIGQNDQ